jgi:2,3-dihydroxyphenylpropionate 1,2-dioxygenase
MDIVGGYACSHAGIITTRRALAPESAETAVFDAYAAMRDEIRALRPDAIVMVATDHMQVFPLRAVATFAIGVGPVARGLGDGGIDPHTAPVHQDLARSILTGCLERGVDLVFSEDVRIDHSFVMPLELITPDFDVPIVPITQNCNVPPRPSFARSRAVGAAVGAAIAAAGPGRVVVVGTGGISHWVGTAERRAFMNRPAGSRIDGLANFPLVLEETGPVNERFDRDFLELTAAGRLGDFAATWTPERLEEEAGNGAQELRNWLTTAAILGDPAADVMAYEPVLQWLTGTAVVRFRVPVAA